MGLFKQFLFEETIKKAKQKSLGLIHLGKDTYKSKSGNEFVWDVSKQNFVLKKSIQNKIVPTVKQSFSIPEKLKNSFKIEGNLSNIESWKAKIFSNNSGDGKSKEGDFQDVGYVLVSLDSDIIIPVARNDEHRTGYDVMHDYIAKKLIPKENYVSIFSKGHDYVYSDSEKDTKQRLEALKKWRSYGGSNFEIEDPDKNYIGTVDDFINAEGKVKTEKGKLNPIGSKFVNSLEKISIAVKLFNENPNNAQLYSKNLFKNARNLLRDFNRSSSSYGYNYYLSIDDKDMEKFQTQLDKAEAEDDWKKVEQIFFSHDGIKNKIHMNLRKFIKKDDYSSRYYKKFFGDLEKANNEFNRLGDI